MKSKQDYFNEANIQINKLAKNNQEPLQIRLDVIQLIANKDEEIDLLKKHISELAHDEK